MSSDVLTANGFDLQPSTGWCWPEDLSELMAGPGWRGENVVVPGRHGVIRTPNKRATETDLVLPLWVFGRNPSTGATAFDSEQQLHTNLDRIRAVFRAPVLQLVHSWGGVAAREAVVEPDGDPVSIVRHNSSPAAARLGIPLTLLGGFWADLAPVTHTVAGTTGTAVPLTAFAEATAPMAELTITVFGPCNNPMLMHGDRTVQYLGVIAAGRQLVINTGNWSVSAGTGAAWTPDLRNIRFSPGPSWFELDPPLSGSGPPVVTWTHTGGGSASCSITGRRKYLNP